VLQDVECTVIGLDLIAWLRLKFTQECYSFVYGVQSNMSVRVYPARPLDEVTDVKIEQKEEEGCHSVGPRFGKGS